jgi:hypothetical protein
MIVIASVKFYKNYPMIVNGLSTQKDVKEGTSKMEARH